MIYAIADLHLDISKKKNMEIFEGPWKNYEEKIFSNWRNYISEEDTVIVSGDICWAKDLSQALLDLQRIDNLPGKKILIKGNHDYWWSTLSKMNNLGLKSIVFLHNNSYFAEEYQIIGTKGFSFITDIDNDSSRNIYNKELNRLRLSLNSIIKSDKKLIAALHYPPFEKNAEGNDFLKVLKEVGVSICVYGHLHSDDHKYIIEGKLDGIELHCVSGDYLDFKAKRII